MLVVSAIWMAIIGGLAASGAWGQNIDSVGYCTLGSTYGMEIQGDYAYVMGEGNDVSRLWIINISNPTNPNPISYLDLPIDNARDLAVDGNYVYIIADITGGLEVIDASDLYNPEIIGTYTEWGRPKNIYKYQSYLYLCTFLNYNYYFQVIDIADPGQLSSVDSLNIDTWWNDLYISGNYAYISGYSEVLIMDIINPANPQLVWRVTPPGTSDLSGGIYVRDNYLYLGAEYGNLKIYDISDPSNFVLFNDIDIQGEIYEIESDSNFAYMQGFSGLQIFDISNPAVLIPVGRFHVYSYREGLGSSNGYLYLTDYSNGLYVLRFTPQFGCLAGAVYDSLTHEPMSGVVVSVMPGALVDTTDSQGGFLFPDIYNISYAVSFNYPDYYPETIESLTVIGNDTTYLTKYLRPYLAPDVGVSAILGPQNRMRQDTASVLISEVANMGTEAQTFDVIFNIFPEDSDTAIFADTVPSISLAAFSVDTVTFPHSFTPLQPISYRLVSYTNLINDEYRVNDTATVIMPCYGYPYLIYGNHDASVMPVANGDTIDIPAWGVSYDIITFMHLPLASNDSIISARLGGYFPDPWPGYWDDQSFLSPESMGDGWTNQSMQAFNWFHSNGLFTLGDTTIICTFRLVVMADSSVIGDTIYPFREGYNAANHGLLWGLIGGLYAVIPITTYPRLVILPSSSCHYVVGDINGDGVLNGLDAVYGVSYFKGGPLPPYNCECSRSSTWFVACDLNGSCSFNGLDITYMVAYLKGGPAPHPCPNCPPGY